MSIIDIDATVYRHVLGHYPTGVCVVTAFDGQPVGMAVGSFTSVSLDPPLVAFLPDKRSTSWPRIERSGKFCVNILGRDQLDVCTRFAVSGSDKFAGLVHQQSANGSPVIDGVLAWIDCDLHDVVDAGDHLIVLGRVRQLEAASASEPLIFFRGSYGGFKTLG